MNRLVFNEYTFILIKNKLVHYLFQIWVGKFWDGIYLAWSRSLDGISRIMAFRHVETLYQT